ncbi:MAG TPA: hypothetical protein VFH48_24745 [Chloroflexota bacterium]|nr:hypothetical protein [Chloroflexota bacterium]
MTQSSVTIQGANKAAYIPFESPILIRAADVAPYDEDDAVMDSWLASLNPREFESILSKLAETESGNASALEFSA